MAKPLAEFTKHIQHNEHIRFLVQVQPLLSRYYYCVALYLDLK
jgi:hypothetical protein